jgi:hypothetical protein
LAGATRRRGGILPQPVRSTRSFEAVPGRFAEGPREGSPGVSRLAHRPTVVCVRVREAPEQYLGLAGGFASCRVISIGDPLLGARERNTGSLCQGCGKYVEVPFSFLIPQGNVKGNMRSTHPHQHDLDRARPTVYAPAPGRSGVSDRKHRFLTAPLCSSPLRDPSPPRGWRRIRSKPARAQRTLLFRSPPSGNSRAYPLSRQPTPEKQNPGDCGRGLG